MLRNPGSLRKQASAARLRRALASLPEGLPPSAVTYELPDGLPPSVATYDVTVSEWEDVEVQDEAIYNRV